MSSPSFSSACIISLKPSSVTSILICSAKLSPYSSRYGVGTVFQQSYPAWILCAWNILCRWCQVHAALNKNHTIVAGQFSICATSLCSTMCGRFSTRLEKIVHNNLHCWVPSFNCNTYASDHNIWSVICAYPGDGVKRVLQLPSSITHLVTTTLNKNALLHVVLFN